MNEQFPVWLTPMQAVAWIMLRDPQWVQRAGDLTTDGEGHHEEVTLPDWRVGILHVPGNPGVNKFRLDWEAVERHHSECPAHTGGLGRIAGNGSDAAVGALIAALRDGRLVGQGKAAGNSLFQPIPPIEWHDMGLREDGVGKNALVATTLFTDGSPTLIRAHWQNVKLASADTLRLWPRDVVTSASAETARAAEWMRCNVTSRGAWKRDFAIRQCRHDAKCTDAVAKNAWNGLPDFLKGTRGRPRKTAKN